MSELNKSVSVIFSESFLNSFRTLPAGEVKYNRAECALSAWLGYDRAEFTFGANLNEVEEWLTSGLLRHVVVYSPGLDIVWEGFVNEVRASFGYMEVVRGTVVDVANRVYAIYSPTDYSKTPPVTGSQRVTPIVQDTDSQAKYGIWEKVIEVGEVSKDQALQVRDMFLQERKEVETSTQYGSESASAPSITVGCLGYGYFLGAYTYMASLSGLSTITTRILSILGASSNAVFSTDYSLVSTNSMLIPCYDADVMADTAIMDAVPLGDINDNRWLFGFYAGRRAVYQPASTTVDYIVNAMSGRPRLLDKNLYEIAPWEVLPGRWAFFQDMLPGETFQEPVRVSQDPRSMFIEAVRYRIPGAFDLEGSKTGRLDQKLAKLTMSAGLYA